MFEIRDSDWLCDKVASITTDDSRPKSLTVPLSRGEPLDEEILVSISDRSAA